MQCSVITDMLAQPQQYHLMQDYQKGLLQEPETPKRLVLCAVTTAKTEPGRVRMSTGVIWTLPGIDCEAGDVTTWREGNGRCSVAVLSVG